MYAIHNSQEVLEQALQLARGSYQADILLGREALSGATLRGKAAKYSSKYKQSAQSIMRRCQLAGLPVREQIGAHGKRLVVIG